MMRTASQPDKRYFFGVADRTEPSGGQGFQYDRLVRSVLYEADSDNTILDIERADLQALPQPLLHVQLCLPDLHLHLMVLMH
jgi:hypothetical protein